MLLKPNTLYPDLSLFDLTISIYLCLPLSQTNLSKPNNILSDPIILMSGSDTHVFNNKIF